MTHIANADKTHCPAGHAYDERNTYLDGQNRRHCRICMAAANKRLRNRSKETR